MYIIHILNITKKQNKTKHCYNKLKKMTRKEQKSATHSTKNGTQEEPTLAICEKCGVELEEAYVSEEWRDEFCTEDARNKSLWMICEECIDEAELAGLVYHKVKI